VVCKEETTPWQTGGDWDKDEFYYMDRHKLSCTREGGVIQSWKLQQGYRETGSLSTTLYGWVKGVGRKIRFQYKCCYGLSEGSGKLRHTDFNVMGRSGSLDHRSLNKHAVICDIGQALNFIKLDRNEDHDKVRYNYNCVDVPRIKADTCAGHTTTLTRPAIHGYLQPYYLNLPQQPVTCKAKNQVLRGFKLRPPDHPGSYWLQYNVYCCEFDS
jgi:hypothetical protein